MAHTNPYRSGAMFLWLAAVLVAIAPVLGGPIGYVAVGLIMAALAMGLMRGMRWVAYFAFLIVGITGGIVLGWVWSIAGPPVWWALATTAACWLGALALFAALWRAKPDPNTA